LANLRHLFFLFLFVTLALDARCQTDDKKVMRQQISLLCDNDFFLFNGEDGYYTNGLFLRYDRVSAKPSTHLVKKIFSYELGQMIYNAHSSHILPNANNGINLPGGIEQIDRPIAGYLYGKFSMTLFYNEPQMLSFGVSVGTTGQNSLGQDVQQFWHNVIGVKGYWNWVWAYQVKNEVSMNVHTTYAKSLIDREKNSRFQITPVSQATLGTAFINLSQSVLFQFGKLRSMSSSSYWLSRIGTSNILEHGGIEWFLYYKPEVGYQLYNATIQGGLFNTDKGPILSDVSPFVFSHEIGVRFSSLRYCVGYSVSFRSKEAKSQFSNESFASIFLSYRFR